jgi:predicted ATPase
MLTSLHVQGFKNLLDVKIDFGPFTCIAGFNAAGKSNVFDAIRFLHLLTEKSSIMEAAQSLRDTHGRALQPADLFTKLEDYTAPEMRFVAELVVDQKVEDDFGVKAKAAISTLRYELRFALNDDTGMLELTYESLTPIKLSEARKSIAFTKNPKFLQSVISGRRTVPFISTSSDAEITVHQEGHGGRKLPAVNSSRTILGGTNVADFPTILAARHEMSQWRTLLLEPSAMRASSKYTDPQSIDVRGGNLANTIYRLANQERIPGQVCSELANKLSKLVEDVRNLRVVSNDRFEARTIELQGRDGIYHPAHALSDGTLRFLVLSVLDLDPDVRGMICLEEPENGIHPERIPVMLELLHDIAVDPDYEVNHDNPMRQVVVNTHSPLVVVNTREDDLVYMGSVRVADHPGRGLVAQPFVPFNSWRDHKTHGASPVAPGSWAAYRGSPKGGQGWFDFMADEKALVE